MLAHELDTVAQTKKIHFAFNNIFVHATRKHETKAVNGC